MESYSFVESPIESAGPAGPDLLPFDDNNLILIPNFILPDEQTRLLRWASNMRPHLKANGRSRTFAKVSRLPAVPPLYRQVRLRLQDMLGLPRNAAPEPMFGWYVSVISDGGAVHPHRDPAPEGQRHLRCNLFLQLPQTGGFPIVEGQHIPIEERTLLAFFPSEKRHSSEAVTGTRWRVICSFGYLVPESYTFPEAVSLAQSPIEGAHPLPSGTSPELRS